MKLIESKAELVLQQEGLEGVYKQIELCGRTCYKSENKITEDSAKGFVERMIKSNHTAMLEHGTVYLAMPVEIILPIEANGWGKYKNKYSKTGIVCEVNGKQRVAITTNLRVLVENGWLDDLRYVCEPTPCHERRYTFKFTTDRGVSHELVRHRVFSFAQESTRYCNYNSSKFGKELVFIKPSWFNEDNKEVIESYFMFCEKLYLNLTDGIKQVGIVTEPFERKYTAQEARAVLPNALKTEICMTGFAGDWRFFFDLRYYGKTGKPHPDMELLAGKARAEFIKAGLWDEIMKYPSKFDNNDIKG